MLASQLKEYVLAGGADEALVRDCAAVKENTEKKRDIKKQT